MNRAIAVATIGIAHHGRRRRCGRGTYTAHLSHRYQRPAPPATFAQPFESPTVKEPNMTRPEAALFKEYVGRKAMLLVLDGPPVRRRVQDKSGKDAYETSGGREGFKIAVTIIDVRPRYGCEDALVKPLSGVGTEWVEIVKPGTPNRICRLEIVQEWPDFDEQVVEEPMMSGEEHELSEALGAGKTQPLHDDSGAAAGGAP